MRDDCLLLAIKMSDRFLMLSLNLLNDILCLANHSVVLIVKLFHSQYVVTASLLCQL